jgi:hypothetical protein
MKLRSARVSKWISPEGVCQKIVGVAMERLFFGISAC